MSDFDVDSLANLERSTYSRSIDLLSAINRSGDFEFIASKIWAGFGGVDYELHIVVLTCDGIPDVNSNGIEYRERLGILVGPDDFDIPDVWTLRNNFPYMIHMNDRPAYMPNSICLYFENKTAVNRTWTADKFLKRIYWWIESSSKGTLHAADQPVEQFFFDARYELLITPDANKNINEGKSEVSLTRHIKRKNETGTFFLEKTDGSDRDNEIPVRIIILESPPVVHGSISPSPHNLSSLFGAMASVGGSPKDILKEKIQNMVPVDGLSKNKQECRTIIIVKIPIKREHQTQEERIESKAFLTIESPIEIGEKMGFLMQSPDDEKIYIDAMGSANSLSADEIDLFPVEVLKLNSKEDFRNQSGIQQEGGKFSLIGLGALGSVLFDLWNRSGWGEWVLIDKDHVKPHNITRHVVGLGYIGWNKAYACADRAQSCTGNNGDLAPFDDDAMCLSQDARDAVNNTSLVIDVSTTLDYPRLASFDNNNPRHCSIFITPSGNDAVLLFEDRERSCRLRSLEAQYYRAVIGNKWGEGHLAGHLGSFISGAGCRDISLKLPFSSIVGHASILSEQVMKHSGTPEATIKVWRKDVLSGAINCIEQIASNELMYTVGEYKIFMDDGLKSKIYSMRNSALPSETGGILLGYHDFNLEAIFVVDAFPAPIDSESSSSSFQRGTQGVIESVNDARSRTANIVDYIGEWHSHPKNTSATQSGVDLIQLSTLASLLADDGIPAVQLIAGEREINIILGAAYSA